MYLIPVSKSSLSWTNAELTVLTMSLAWEQHNTCSPFELPLEHNCR